LVVVALCCIALLACASAASAATPAPQELGVACISPFLVLVAPTTAGKCGPGHKPVSLLPGPTSLCVVPLLDAVYIPSVTARCVRPFTSLTVPSATANAYFCPGVLGLLAVVTTPKCPGGARVYAVTKPPQAVNDVAGVTDGEPTATGNVLANDLYISLNPVTVTALTSSGVVTKTAPGFKASLADGSTLTVSSAGAYSFTASAGFFKTCSADATGVFGYTITNAYGQASSASLTVTVACPPAQSQAVNDSGSLNYNAGGASSATGNLLANDKGLSSDPSTITVVGGVAPVNGVVTVAGTYGTLVVQTSGPNAWNYTYTPSGLPATCSTFTDSFTYTLTDTYGRSSSASIAITLNCNQPAPIATAQSTDVSDTAQTASGNLLAGVTTADGDIVSLAQVGASGATTLTVHSTTTLVLPDGATLAVQPDGAYIFTPSPGFFTTCSSDATDTVDYTVVDEFGQTTSSTLTIKLHCFEADLSITLTDGGGGVFSAATNDTTGGVVAPGASLVYTFVVFNSGPDSAVGASVTDILPAALTNTVWAVTGTSGGASVNSSSGTGNIDDTVTMPVDSSITFTIDTTVPVSASGTVSNTVTVTPPSSVVDPTSTNDTSTDTVTLTPE